MDKRHNLVHSKFSTHGKAIHNLICMDLDLTERVNKYDLGTKTKSRI